MLVPNLDFVTYPAFAAAEDSSTFPITATDVSPHSAILLAKQLFAIFWQDNTN